MPEVEYPALFAAADSAAISGERWYARLIELDLLLVALAALIAGVSSVAPTGWREVVAGLVVLLIAGAVLSRWVNRGIRRDKAWFDGRSVAESVKTASWRYMMRAAPFSSGSEEADGQFVGELAEILRARKDLSLDPTKSGPQITSAMRDVRGRSFHERKDFYIDNRLLNQVTWYSNRANLHRSRAKVWFAIGIGAELIALAWAVIRVIWSDTVNLIGFFTSIAAAATALGQLQRNDELSRSYALAAQELQLIRSLIDSANAEERFLDLVEDSEGAISREHTMWMAKRT